jgi:hypothetical protein
MQLLAKNRILIAISLVIMGVSAGCAGHVHPPAAGNSPPGAGLGVIPAAQATPIPGTDPAIQRWFLSSGAVKVAFNNALLRAERGVASGSAADCQPLDTAVRALSAALPKLGALSPAGQKLAAAIQPPVSTFRAAATACLAKDFAAAKTSLDTGVRQQAEAQGTVDEILDGGL